MAPGFAVQRQTLGLSYAMGAPGRAHVEVNYRLQNAGNQDLTVLQAVLPAALDLHARVDCREVAIQTTGPSQRGSLLVSIPFEPSWPQKARRDVEIEYDLALPQVSSGGGRALCFLQAEEWFPELKKPRGIMVKGAVRGEEVIVSIRVPQGFRALSSGQSLGVKTRDGEAEYRYRLRDTDFEPFLLAGQYQEREFRAAGATVVFWTTELLPADKAQHAATTIAGIVQAYETAFGRRGRKASPVWIVEAAAHPSHADAGNPAGAALPSAALLDPAIFAQGVDSQAFLDLAARELARTWFGWMVVPRQDLAPDRNLGEALVQYATIVAGEARGGEREHRVAQFIQQFDQQRQREADKPLLRVEFKDSSAQQEMAVEKSTLFLLALEDAYGKDRVRHALAYIVRAIPQNDFGLAVLRAALERETHQQLADFFRVWLDHTGIPADFRAHYKGRPDSDN